MPLYWINLTYLYTLLSSGKHVGTDVAQSGLGNDNQEKVFHSYYQWVPFTLFFQVIASDSFFSINSIALTWISRFILYAR